LFNASAGIATAYAVSSLILVVTGETNRHPTGAGHGEFGRVSDKMTWIRPITKWAAWAQSPAEIPALVHEVFHQLKTGRPRPVELEISAETLAAETDVELLEREDYEPPSGRPERIQHAAQILAGAQRPVIWAGGGVHRSGASPSLLALAEHLQAAVVTSRNGKGAITAPASSQTRAVGWRPFIVPSRPRCSHAQAARKS